MRNVPFLSLSPSSFFLGGLSSEALHLLLLNFWMPVPSLGMCFGVRRILLLYAKLDFS